MTVLPPARQGESVGISIIKMFSYIPSESRHFQTGPSSPGAWRMVATTCCGVDTHRSHALAYYSSKKSSGMQVVLGRSAFCSQSTLLCMCGQYWPAACTTPLTSLLQLWRRRLFSHTPLCDSGYGHSRTRSFVMSPMKMRLTKVFLQVEWKTLDTK